MRTSPSSHGRCDLRSIITAVLKLPTFSAKRKWAALFIRQMGAVYSQLPDYYIIFFYTVFSVFVVYLTNDPQGVAYTTLQGGIIY